MFSVTLLFTFQLYLHEQRATLVAPPYPGTERAVQMILALLYGVVALYSGL